MVEISFERLVSVVARVEQRLSSEGRLCVAKPPEPFAAPPLIIESEDSLKAEVILVKASAAVGKSTMARHLSASCNAPLLDLSSVPVSTGTLKSLILDVKGIEDPIDAFHSAKLPIIVDALDEGRLLSGETGFESFMQTIGEFLLQNREVVDHPKLVLLGRHDSVEDAKTWLEIVSSGFLVRAISVGYFEENEARTLINSYALSCAEKDSAYNRHQEPARKLIDAYFSAIEAAVGAAKGQLWNDPQGKSFAGYAPILAALGSLLAKIDNFSEVVTRLASTGRQEAWDVIETVLDEILKREQNKLRDKLSTQLSCAIPGEVYDPHEQLLFLARKIHGQPSGSSNRVKLPPTEQIKYHTMVEQYIGEHPFVRQGRPTNDVLGSLVLAYAIAHDLLKFPNHELLANLSQQPFIWRSFHAQIEHSDEMIIDGELLGFILNSYWNDPNTTGSSIVIRSFDNTSASVRLPVGNGKTSTVIFTAPLCFYSQIRSCDINFQNTIRLEGRTAKGAGSAFYFRDQSTLISKTLDVKADSLIIDGRLWMEAELVNSSARLALHPRTDAEVGWGGSLSDTFPWNRIPSTLKPPYRNNDGDTLIALLDMCVSRLPNGVFVVSNDYTFEGTENLWVAHYFSNEFPRLLRLLVKHNLATEDKFNPSATQNKKHIRLNITWADLRNAIDAKVVDINPAVASFLNEARSLIGHT